MGQAKNKQIILQQWGCIAYKEAWEKQEDIFRSTIDQKILNRNLAEEERLVTDNYLIVCHHPPVYTLGKSGSMENLLLSHKELRERKIDFFKINRGGDITFHGPGQIVGYPILDLDNFFTDIHTYLRLLEDCIILTLKEYGIIAGRLKGATGVWLDAADKKRARKICAMGIRCSRWVTMHGWAFNVNTDLEYFDHIIPCGIEDKSVTSMHKELGTQVSEEEVLSVILKHFCNLFDAKLQ